MNILCIAQWLSGANFEILNWSDVFARYQKNYKLESTFMQIS